MHTHVYEKLKYLLWLISALMDKAHGSAIIIVSVCSTLQGALKIHEQADCRKLFNQPVL